MNSSKCKYCGNKFSNPNVLKTHQKTTKYCLKIQGKTLSNKNKCKGCKKIFSLPHHLETHTNKCKDYTIRKYKRKIERYAGIIAQKDKLINDLEKALANDEGKIEILEKVVDKPKTVNTVNTMNTNNYVNPKLLAVPIANIRPFTIETVREEITKGGYTYEMFTRGMRGLTDFVSGMIIEDQKPIKSTEPKVMELDSSEDTVHERNYVCTDSSRNKFHRLLKSKEWSSDNGAHFLGKVLNELTPSANEYYSRVIGLMKAAKTDDDRIYADMFHTLTKNIYFGITKHKSKERKHLFKQLRMEIRSIAAI